MSYLLKQNQTAQPLLFLMVDSSDHVSPKTGLSPAVAISKNGGAYAAPGGTVAEVGNGLYKVSANATDADALGPLALHATAAGADPVDVLFMVVGFDPLSSSMGLSGVEADVRRWAGKAVPTPSVDGAPKVDVGYLAGEVVSGFDGAAQAGSADSITLDAAEAAAANALTGRRITITAGAGLGQSRIVTAYSGPPTRKATVHRPWDVVPDASSRYILDAAEVDAVAVGGRTLGEKTGPNLDRFFQNAGGDTAKVVDDVGGSGSGSGGATGQGEWTIHVVRN